MDIPPIVSGLYQIKEDEEENARNSRICSARAGITDDLRQALYCLMLKHKCILLGIIYPWDWCFDAVKSLTFIRSVPCCESKNRTEQEWILYSKRDQTSERVVVTVIDNEELAYTIIIFSSLA
jgi:hypothetical protein